MHSYRFLGMLLLAAGVFGCGDDTTGPSDDPALVGRWTSYARSTDTGGVPGCRFLDTVLRFRADQTLADSMFTIDASDPLLADSLAFCDAVLIAATVRAWGVPEAGRLVLTPGFVSASDTLDYEVAGDTLRVGLLVFVKSP